MSGCGGKSDESGAPMWDAARAASLVGKYLLIGITYFEADGETLIEQRQRHGIISSVDADVGITVALHGERAGETIVLPPHLPAFEDAAPGEYHLHESGEIVTDPDLTTMWKIVRPQN
ncbi:MAG: hypothetical protein NW217_00425 [Hyphomicrobiaceae bacterium]|nr:hypothetical protein [Hyphomicrobiaceae bacterium]